MKNPSWPFYALLALTLSGCAGSAPQVRRLSPIQEGTPTAPQKCVLISVFAESPAARAGLKPQDAIESVNGKTPKDAPEVADLINASPSDADLGVSSSSGAVSHVKVRLNAAKPRLGAVCDLTGWRKSGITAAGNESLTLFQGPYSVTGSGIIDKGIVFLRVRVSNSSTKPLPVGPDVFKAADGNRSALPVMTPQQVMCYLYGDKGAQLLAVKRRQKESPDNDTAPKESHLTEEACSGGSTVGRVSGADLQYAQANADYLATESLWPATLNPGETADGLIYMQEPTALPIHLEATVESQRFELPLGMPQATGTAMKPGDISDFLEKQKRASPVRVTLKKGKVIVGKFSSYDNIDEKLWLDVSGAAVGIPLTSIRVAEPIEQNAPKGPPSDHVN